MNKLRLYRIDINYIKYLYQFDKKVQYNFKKNDDYTERLETYNRSQKNKFLKKVCCNFKLLEEKLTKYREC